MGQWDLMNLGGHKQNLVPTRTQEKAAVTHKRLSQTCPRVSRSLLDSGLEAWVDSGLLQGQEYRIQQPWEARLAGISSFV